MKKPSPFSGKIVWITGASSGIGEAMAYDFAKCGSSVILTARRADRLESIAAKINAEFQGAAKTLPADLSKINELEDLAKQATALFGRIDVLVNNAGFSQRSQVLETPLELERKVIEVDLVSPIALTKAVLPQMVSRKSGRIIVTSSLMGYLELPGNATYACVKHGLNGYFYSLGFELAQHGIQVQVMEPGFVKTEVTLSAMTATGEPYGKMDTTHANAMSAEAFSKRAIQQLEAGKTEIIIAGMEGIALRLRWWFPALYRFLIHRFAMKVLKERFKDKSQ
jgi:short-subunit dehydrogenase